MNNMLKLTNVQVYIDESLKTCDELQCIQLRSYILMYIEILTNMFYMLSNSLAEWIPFIDLTRLQILFRK